MEPLKRPKKTGWPEINIHLCWKQMCWSLEYGKSVKTNNMIKIKTILNHGGACPFQIDALTDDDRLIYGRYRFGNLSVQIGEAGDHSEFAAVRGEEIFGGKIGDDYDGSMNLEEFKEHTKETLDFSEAAIDS